MIYWSCHIRKYKAHVSPIKGAGYLCLVNKQKLTFGVNCINMKKPLLLVIRDGWGIGNRDRGDAVNKAATPNMERFIAGNPHNTLVASGEMVGVRSGSQGSSEVGHLNMGAGRIVEQEVLRVDKIIRDGSFFSEPLLLAAAENCRKNKSAFHIMGLVQNQGVHATEEHLFALLDFAKRQGLCDVFIHFFSDGRDTPPRSALVFLDRLEKKISEFGVGIISSVIGRYYAMDRGNNWDRTKRAYDAMVCGNGAFHASSAREAIESAYKRVDACGVSENDEFIQPTLLMSDGRGLIKPGDSVINFNYRQDRAIQLARAFVEPNFADFERGEKLDICYVGLTRYYDEFAYAVIPPMNMSNILGGILSKNGLSQLRIAEYQKFKHVTSFFNSKTLKPFPLEDRVEVESISTPENKTPEMSAYEVTEIVLRAVEGSISEMRRFTEEKHGATFEGDTISEERGRDTYDVIILNYANCDMVGHTGDLNAAIKAVEVVDECVGRVVDAVLKRGGAAIITADHGNAEQMIDPTTGKAQTSHTVKDVELILATNDSASFKLKAAGKLSDIAPTMLELLGLPIPREMTASSLLV